MNTAAVFESLEGNWTFERIIKDSYLNKQFIANGDAVFKPLTVSSFDYIENGFVQNNNEKYAFSRKFIFNLLDDEIQVLFNDGISKGKIFNRLISSKLEHHCSDSHTCKLDQHLSNYLFINKHLFMIKHTVIGPSVAYVSITSFFKSIK